MNKVILFSILLIANIAFSQSYTPLLQNDVLVQVQNQNTQEQKEAPKAMLPGQKLRNVGLVMLGGGAFLGVISAISISNAEFECETTATSKQCNTQDASGGLGILGLVVAVPVTITGGILAIVGNSKMKRYKRTLTMDNQLKIDWTPELNGNQNFTVSYNF